MVFLCVFESMVVAINFKVGRIAVFIRKKSQAILEDNYVSIFKFQREKIKVSS